MAEIGRFPNFSQEQKVIYAKAESPLQVQRHGPLRHEDFCQAVSVVHRSRDAQVTAALLLARAHWKPIGIGLLCLALAVQSVRLGHAHNQLERAKINLNEARAELKRISTAKNEQAERTERNIDLSQKRIQIADKIARRVEEAPTPPDCATAPEVMGADL